MSDALELSKQELTNVLSFLDRVPVKGINETMAMASLIQKFDQAIKQSESPKE